MKRLILTLALIVTLVGGFTCFPAPSQAAEAKLSPELWMGQAISDTTPFGAVNIPGTHDSAAYKMNGASVFTTAWAKAQSMSVPQQLNSGIRYLDLRVYDDLSMHHGVAWVGIDLPTHLKEVNDFLAAHPSEFVVVRLKNERGDAYNSSLAKNLKEKVFNNAALTDRIATDVDGSTAVANLRGKIVLINDTNMDLPLASMRWNKVIKQDKYQAKSEDEKWSYVEQFLNFKQQNPSALVLNHLSYTRSSTALHRLAQSMNARYERHLGAGDTHAPCALGVTIMDFPPQSLIDAIISSNLRTPKNTP